MDAITHEMNAMKRACGAFHRVSKILIPDAYDLPGSYIDFLYQEHMNRGENANGFYYAIVAAFKMGFSNGQRAARKGAWVESPRRIRGKTPDKAVEEE